METRGFWDLEHVSDAVLRSGIYELCASSCRVEARVIAHLAEVERRQLHRKDGFSSLYKYCLLGLGLSENQAFNRMTGARIALSYPIVFELLAQRKLHLSGLCLLRDYLTPENHGELLEAIADKTKAQVLVELARRFPAASREDAVRRLPKSRIAPAVGRPGEVIPTQNVLDPITGEVTAETARALRYRVQFDASAELKAKIDLAKALSSHVNPTGDLETLFERALDAYVEQLQKKRFGKTDKPRARPAARAAPERSNQEADAPKRNHIPHETRREVVARDGLRCAYVSPTGRRCDEQVFLQFHHRHAHARRGGDGPDNLSVYCASHNQWQASQDFGAEHIEQRIAAARARAANDSEARTTSEKKAAAKPG